MSSSQRPASRFMVARSSSPLLWGTGLIVLGTLVRELAMQRHLELLLEGGDSSWSVVGWVGAVIALVGLVALLVGIVHLSGNVDYLAAREAERHRAEARSAD